MRRMHVVGDKMRTLLCKALAAWATAASLLYLLAPPACASELKTYEYPRLVRYKPGDTVRDTFRNTDFIVRVRTPGSAWQDLFEHRVEVDWNNPQSASLVRFDFSGRVEVAIQKGYSRFSSVNVRPVSAGVKARVVGDTAYLTLDKPANLSIEFDGDKHHNLHLFAGALQAEPRTAPADVVVFGPGVHRPPEGSKVFSFKSGQTVLIDGAAVLEAGIQLEDVEDVTIKGHGIIERAQGDVRMNTSVTHDNSRERHIDGSAAIGIRNSRRIRIEGLSILNPPGALIGCLQSRDVSIVDVKGFTGGPWADGVDIYSCQDVDIDRVFLRVSDDCFALYNRRWNTAGDIRNVRVTNSTCWADVAHAMYMGLFGDKEKPEVTENVLFKNIDVLEINETQLKYQGVMGIHSNNATKVRNVRFEDIRVEHIIEGRLFNFAVIGDDRYSQAPGGGIENIVLHNISFSGQGAVSPSLLQGFDTERGVKGIVFSNVRIGGKKLLGPARDLLEIGPFVSDVTYRRLFSDPCKRRCR
jgi:hypothetical protein